MRSFVASLRVAGQVCYGSRIRAGNGAATFCQQQQQQQAVGCQVCYGRHKTQLCQQLVVTVFSVYVVESLLWHYLGKGGGQHAGSNKASNAGRQASDAGTFPSGANYCT